MTSDMKQVGGSGPVAQSPSEMIRERLGTTMHGKKCTACDQSIPGTTYTLADVADATNVKAATLRRFLNGGRIKSDDLDSIWLWLQ